MKRLIIAAAALLVAVSGIVSAGEPCCGVTGVDRVRGLVTVRDKASGRTYQFKADAAALRSLRPGAAVDIRNGAASVAGVQRTYAVVEPAQIAPCCNVVNVQPDPADPVNGVVVALNNMHTGETLQFSGPRNALAGLKIGSKVALSNSGDYAMVQSSASAGGGTYSFPVRTAQATGPKAKPGGEAQAAVGAEDTEYWQITPNPKLKGRTGRIVVTYPGQAALIFHVYGAGNKHLASWYNASSGSFLPGSYIIRIWDGVLRGVPVKKGMETRMKVGVLKLGITEPYELIDSRGGKMFSGHPSDKNPIVFPVGRYTIKTATLNEPIEIKDGEVTEF